LLSETAPRRREPVSPLWIVKLGGSLADVPVLALWLDALAAGGGRIVLVPGGGPFADVVRAAQRQWDFDDATAHRLAIMAMEQYGWMLAGLEPQLQPVASAAAIRRVLRQGGVPVWLPCRMTLGRPDIPESWDMTSDSLAAWLAARLGARGLLLVKSVPVADGSTVEVLAASGVVDPLLPTFLRRGVDQCRCIDAGSHAAMKAALQAGGIAGTPVVTGPREPG
jgi:aspartokinase-like uncharacterized kinase